MNRLQGKDLINIGIFTAIYFIVIFAAASIGFIIYDKNYRRPIIARDGGFLLFLAASATP